VTTNKTISANQDYEGTIVSNDATRHYYLHLPPNYDISHPIPLLIALHGRLGTGKRMSTQTGFNHIADREGFMVVYPDGVKRSWADGRGITRADEQGVNDVAFVERLIETLQGQFSIDRTRIYLVGHSNGGFMALRLSVELFHQFAAAAVVAASLTDSLVNRFKAGRTVSVLFMHGTADPVTPYGGSKLPDGRMTLPVEEAAKLWARYLGCSIFPKVEMIDQPGRDISISVFTYRQCRNQRQVKLYKIEGGGHMWPGEPDGFSEFSVGGTKPDINASEEIWSFFGDKTTLVLTQMQ
jgi:polyhydroxybutyrate depolymerase